LNAAAASIPELILTELECFIEDGGEGVKVHVGPLIFNKFGLLKAADDKRGSVFGFGLLQCSLQLTSKVLLDAVHAHRVFQLSLRPERILSILGDFG